MKKSILLLCLLGSMLAAGTNIVRNSDFSASDEQGRPAPWQCQLGKMQILAEGIRGQKMLEIQTVSHQEQFKGNLIQFFEQMKSGDYILSGYFRGDASALWIVVNYADQSAFKLWLPQHKFQASDVQGWWRFSNKIHIPEDAAKGFLVIEPFSKDKEGKIHFSNILMEYQED
jgi:hypothetical protein